MYVCIYIYTYTHKYTYIHMNQYMQEFGEPFQALVMAPPLCSSPRADRPARDPSRSGRPRDGYHPPFSIFGSEDGGTTLLSSILAADK